jgi:predicted TIM-barrel fold metal-dependent hydrolase
VLAASNWPVVLASAPRYADLWRELPGLLTHLDDRQRAAVLGENARALFSIGS